MDLFAVLNGRKVGSPTWTRVRCSKAVTVKCQPCLALAALGGASLLLLLWGTHTRPVFGPLLFQPLHLRGGSKAGTPCLLTATYGISCWQLVTANLTYMQQLGNRTWKETGKCRQTPLEKLAQDCDALTEQHGYHRWPTTPQEREFPLAFGLKIHHAPGMLARLLRVLWRPHNFYCIHVDSKTPPEVYELIRNVSDCLPNVVMAETRINLVYLSVASLLSDLECMRMALKSSVPWRYYLNLSGQEFPLRTNLEMVQILRLLGGRNDVESYLPTRYVSSWFHFKYLVVNDSVVPTEMTKPPFTYPLQIRKGSAYGAFSRGFVDFALNSQLAREFLHWLSDAMAPDELFWATLNHLKNVPGAVHYPVSHRYKTVLSRAVVWEWDEGYRCQSYVRGVCIFTAWDLAWLVRRPELIANKFNDRTDPIVLDCLESALEARSLQDYAAVMAGPASPAPLKRLDWAFYRSLPHLKPRPAD